MFESLPTLPNPSEDDYVLEYSNTLLLKAKLTKLRLLNEMPSLEAEKEALLRNIEIMTLKIQQRRSTLEKYKQVEEYVDIYDQLDREVKRMRKLQNRKNTLG